MGVLRYTKIMRVNTTVPGLREATKIMADLKRLGINDVELMFDKEIKMWAVFQTLKPSGKILLVGQSDYYRSEPTLMWWCKDPETGTYRTPNDQDLSDIIITVKNAQIWFEKGSDYMIDKIEAKEQKEYEERKRRQSNRIRSYAKPLRKHWRREIG